MAKNPIDDSEEFEWAELDDKLKDLVADLKNVSDDAEYEQHSTAPFSISSYGADYTVDSLVKRLKSETFFVPDFQRLYVWNIKLASRFIESLLMGLPVPGIFVFRQADTSKHLIIDGQQRLKTLQFFYEGIFGNKKFRLVDVRRPWLNKSYSELTESDRLRLDDSVIHTTVFRQELPTNNDQSIYEVFERINTGGSKLSDQEIRVCVNFGSFTNLLRNLNTNSDWRSVYGPQSVRLKDEELILRFLALYERHNFYSRPLRDFLNNYLADYRDLPDDSDDRFTKLFSITIRLVREALGESAFRPERSLNTAVLDAVMVGLGKRLETGVPIDRGQVKVAYEELITSSDFRDAYSRSTADEEKVKRRIELATRAFASVE